MHWLKLAQDVFDSRCDVVVMSSTASECTVERGFASSDDDVRSLPDAGFASSDDEVKPVPLPDLQLDDVVDCRRGRGRGKGAGRKATIRKTLRELKQGRAAEKRAQLEQDARDLQDPPWVRAHKPLGEPLLQQMVDFAKTQTEGKLPVLVEKALSRANHPSVARKIMSATSEAEVLGVPSESHLKMAFGTLGCATYFGARSSWGSVASWVDTVTDQGILDAICLLRLVGQDETTFKFREPMGGDEAPSFPDDLPWVCSVWWRFPVSKM
jgi:hypothetical protein